jgi:imidazolonepropionase-like amidohydrolase
MDYFHRLGVPDEVKLLRCTLDLRKIVEAGFTAVRDCGSGCGLYLKTCVEEGTLFGPRIITSHRYLSQTAGHGDAAYLPMHWASESNKCRIADGVDDVRKAAREQLREGADFLKICTSGGIMSRRFNAQQAQYSLEEVKVVVEEAERVGTFVSSHAGGNEGIKLALEGGVKTLEHGYFLDDPNVLELMKEKSAIYIPTLILTSKISQGEEYGVSPWALEKAKAALKFHIAAFELAKEAGINIAMGTDSTGAPLLPHGESAKELEMMVMAGMSAMEAIVASTKIAAEALGMSDQIGTIEKNKFADLLFVDGNPSDDITVLQKKDRIKMVIKGGEILIDKGHD